MDEDEDLAPEGVGEDTAPVEAEEQPISIDTLAVEMGWSPQEKWHGDPEKWKPAVDFVRDTAAINKNLARTVKEVKDQVTNMARTSAQLTERAVAAERERVLAERHEAIDMGDHAAVAKADQKLDTLTVNVPTVQTPEVEDFRQRNAAWFEKDDEATRWAIARAGELAEKGIGSAKRQLEIVEREAKGLFPEYFEEKSAPKGAPLNKPGNRGAGATAKGFASLPEEVKAAALDYEKRKQCTREEYAKLYYEEQGA